MILDDLRADLDLMPFQQRLFLLALVSGHCADSDMERTLDALENLRAQIQAMRTVQ